MKTVKVCASKNYGIVIGFNELNNLHEHISKVPILNKAQRAVIVTDSNVAPLYTESIKNSLKSLDIKVSVSIFNAGELSKKLSTIEQIYDFFLKNHISKSDFIIALGGGVVGDIAGFAAATYLRGINFVQVPTSLLAQIDSSVGGKTGVNHISGKNLIGAFH